MIAALAVMAAAQATGCSPERVAPPREYVGIYLDEFEGQRFFEGARSLKEVDRRGADNVWMEINIVALGAAFGIKRREPWTAYLVRFDGRKRSRSIAGVHPCGYGHMGASNAEISVDRMLSVQTLGRAYD